MKPRSSQKYRWDGETMSSRRQELKITLQALADAIGTSKSYTWEIEQGSQPTAGYAFNIAKVLRKPVSYFISCIDKDIR